MKPDNDSLGEWQAYTERGKTKEERNKRLNESPEKHRDNIKRHVQTVFMLRARK